MIKIRHSESRGKSDFGWLDSRHSFSFGQYYDPNHMGFGPLRVINEDRVIPGQGFDTHGHQDMEIISYVLDGALEHQDSMGNGSIIRPGDVQRMSAGTGVTHSEFNASDTEPVHFLQIWILPERRGLEPGYEQKSFSTNDSGSRLRIAGSRDGANDSVTIHQDVRLYLATLKEHEQVSHTIDDRRLVWVQVARGSIFIDSEQLYPGDGAAVSNTDEINITATDDAEFLLLDMAP